MRKGRCRRWIGQVVGRNINRLHGRYRTGTRRGNPLLQVTHLGTERWLVPYRRWHTAEKRRYLGTRLGKAEDVIDKEQNVFTLIAEVLRHGKTGQAYAQTCAWRLVHLTKDERCFADNARLFHLEPE